VLVVAQSVSDFGSSTGFLGSIAGFSILAIIIAAYRFAVNFRITERGLSKSRGRNERVARYEASLWQNRSAALEWELTRRGLKVPPMGKELRKLVQESENDGDLPRVEWEGRTDKNVTDTGGRPGL
jgi:hypothetical protein